MSRDIRASFAIEAAEADAGAPEAVRFRGLAYGGGKLTVDQYSHGVVIDLETLTLPGAPLPFMASHSRDLSSRLGSATIVRAGGRLLAEGSIVRGTPEADRVVALLRAGGVSISVAAAPGRVVAIKAGQTISVNGRDVRGPIEVAYDARLVELSAVGVPGDPDARAIAASQGRTPTKMEPETNTPPANNPVIATLGPVEQERDRVRSILAAFRTLGHDRERDALIESGASVAEANARALHLLRASRPSASGPVTLAASHAGPTDPRYIAAGAARMLGAGDKALVAAKLPVDVEAPRSLFELAEQCVRADGRDVPRDRHAVVKAAFSSNTFTPALASALSVVAIDAYQETTEAAMDICKRIGVSDFRPQTIARLNGIFKLEEVGDSGELKHAQVGGNVSTLKLATFGKLVQLTRQDIINDERSVLAGIPAELGRESARTIGDLFAQSLANTTFFNVSNSNVMSGSESALDVEALGEAIRKLRVQTAADGRALNFAPKYLLVPPALEMTARALLNSSELGHVDGSPTGNPLRGAAELRVDARLGATEWYLFAGPENAAALIATLDGMEMPKVESVDLPADVLGVGWRAFFDCAVALHEPRAAIRSLGA